MRQEVVDQMHTAEWQKGSPAWSILLRQRSGWSYRKYRKRIATFPPGIWTEVTTSEHLKRSEADGEVFDDPCNVVGVNGESASPERDGENGELRVKN